MTRERDPNRPSEPLAGSTVWHDYDGDSIYGDLDILGVDGPGGAIIYADTFSHEPGVGQFDVEQTALTFYHGDQIGSLRAITGDESGDPPGRCPMQAVRQPGRQMPHHAAPDVDRPGQHQRPEIGKLRPRPAGAEGFK